MNAWKSRSGAPPQPAARRPRRRHIKSPLTHYIDHKKLESKYGGDPKDMKKVADFARRNGLVVIESIPARRSVILSGSAAGFSKAFGVTLQLWEHPSGTYRGRTGTVKVPASLSQVVVGVFGLDNGTFAKPHFRRRPTPAREPSLAARRRRLRSSTIFPRA